jgi:hypothetical protein
VLKDWDWRADWPAILREEIGGGKGDSDEERKR